MLKWKAYKHVIPAALYLALTHCSIIVCYMVFFYIRLYQSVLFDTTLHWSVTSITGRQTDLSGSLGGILGAEARGAGSDSRGGRGGGAFSIMSFWNTKKETRIWTSQILPRQFKAELLDQSNQLLTHIYFSSRNAKHSIVVSSQKICCIYFLNNNNYSYNKLCLVLCAWGQRQTITICFSLIKAAADWQEMVGGEGVSHLAKGHTWGWGVVFSLSEFLCSCWYPFSSYLAYIAPATTLNS